MNYGILAAGEGSRLLREGVSLPKPMVAVGGEPLLFRLSRMMAGPDTESLHILTRPDVRSLAECDIERIESNCEFVCPRVQTPSSLHSCEMLLTSYPRNLGKLVVTTVDTIIRTSDWQQYIRAFEKLSAEEYEGLFVVTPWCDDESPLYVLVDADTQDILAFVDDPTDIPNQLGKRDDGSRRRTRLYVSGGVYGFCRPNDVLHLMRRCLHRGESRMRNFQRSLLRSHLRLRAFVIEKVFDIDHVEDIRKADLFLQQD